MIPQILHDRRALCSCAILKMRVRPWLSANGSLPSSHASTIGPRTYYSSWLTTRECTMGKEKNISQMNEAETLNKSHVQNGRYTFFQRIKTSLSLIAFAVLSLFIRYFFFLVLCVLSTTDEYCSQCLCHWVDLSSSSYKIPLRNFNF